MSDLPPWDELESGLECPFCTPRPDKDEFIFLVRKLGVSSLYLNRNQAHHGTAFLIYDLKHAIRLDQLSDHEWSRYAADLQHAQSAILAAVNPDHINIELLGNAIPHLHWHIIPRYKTDKRWGGPIWTTDLSERPVRGLAEDEYDDLACKINLALSELSGVEYR